MKRFALCLAFFALVGLGLAAHPHVAFTAQLEFEFDGDRCLGFWQEWTFDPFFSADIIMNFDRNNNRRFEAQEIDAIYNNAFINLRNYGFWTILRRGNQRSNPQAVEHFSASLRDNRVVYRFWVSLSNMNLGNDFHVAIFDTTFFCAISYAEPAVRLVQKDSSAPLPRWNREVNRDFPVYYDPLSPASDNTVHTQWRPGLQTAYPEEIHLSPGRP